MSGVTNETILTAISDLSGYVKTLSADMVEVKQDINGIKQEISGMKKEMQRMNEKIDANYKVTKSFDRKISLLNDEILTMRADILELQRAK